jgi:trans-aconitate methyltransferase
MAASSSKMISLFHTGGLWRRKHYVHIMRDEQDLYDIREYIAGKPAGGREGGRTNAMPHEFDGEKYREAAGHQREWGEKLVGELALTGSERILDLGCGDGSLTLMIAERLDRGSVLGIDASEGMIEAAKEVETLNTYFDCRDIDDICCDDEFDVVFSNATLHWVMDHHKLLTNTRRLLKPGGVARFNFAAEGNCRTLYRVVREAMARAEWAAHFTDFAWPWYMPAVDEYESLVAEYDFAERRVWGENADRHFESKDKMIGWIDQPCLVPFLPYLGDDEKLPFRDWVVERMVEETIQPDGTCFEEFRRINVFAQKERISG